MITNIQKINEILENDGVIAFVTDTVWGLGCLPYRETAVKKLYEIKKREAQKPLILMSNEVYNLFDYVKQPINRHAQKIIKQHFPGALTVVLEKSEKTPDYITSNKSTVGIRIPDNKLFNELCRGIQGHVLATTSANLSGDVPALNYKEAVEKVGSLVDYIVPDHGEIATGVASTVIGVIDDKIQIFRQGNVKVEL